MLVFEAIDIYFLFIYFFICSLFINVSVSVDLCHFFVLVPCRSSSVNSNLATLTSTPNSQPVYKHRDQ